MELLPLGSAKLNLNETLGYSAYGGAIFRYEAEHGGLLGVETEVLSPAHSLLYSVETFTGREKKSNIQHSAFWLPTSGTGVFYAAHNASDQAVTLRPKLQLWDKVFDLDAVELPPKGFTRLRLDPEDLRAYIRQTGRRGESVVGGITLEHDGPANAVYAIGWLNDNDAGYSNVMSFADPAAAGGQEFYGVQLFMGKQPDLTGPGGTVDLRTHVVLKNMTAGSVGVSASASYSRGGLVETVPLPPLRLAANAVEEYDLNALQAKGVIPPGVSEVLLKVEYFAAPGFLMGRSYSISSDLSYGLYSKLESRGTGFYSGVYWSLQEGDNTVFTIANVGEKETAATIELAYSGGELDLPAFKLLSGQTQTVNLRRDLPRILRETGTEIPDRRALYGGYRVRSVDDALRARLVVKEHVINPFKKTAAPFYGQCSYVTSVYLSFSGSSITVPLGGTKDVFPYCSWNVGGNTADYGAVLQPDGGNEISISPQYGYTRTISGLNLGQRNMLLSTQVPTIEDPCGDPVFMQASPTPQADVTCVVPTGETITSNGWKDSEGQPTIHKWLQKLLPTQTSFSGRQVTEVNIPGGSEGCHFSGSDYAPFVQHDGFFWPVDPANQWGPDSVGWFKEAVEYYRVERPARSLPLPCQATVPQRMVIDCGQQNQQYLQHNFVVTIGATTVGSKRGSASQQTRTWP